MNKEAVFSFGKITIHNSIVVGEMNPGVTIDKSEIDELMLYCERYFEGKPFGYLSKRINSYSINPVIYLHISENYNISGLAIVSQSELARSNAKIESHFFQKPIDVFEDQSKAELWLNDILNNLKRKNAL